MSFKDHFSGHATSYAAFRPTYPEALFRDLAGHCGRHRTAWDCATGNGQAARQLAPYFERVIATDASPEQIAAAAHSDSVDFRVAPAEKSGIPAHTVDLITVAQALHWFDIDAFFEEAKRVIAPGGLLAVWCYEYCTVDAACDRIIDDIFLLVEDYWPPERTIVDDGYCHISIPLEPLSLPDYSMSMEWTVDDALGYFRTWSAFRRYVADKGKDPFLPLEEPLRRAWGRGHRRVGWPLNVQVGRG